ncbi:MAG: DUF1499 domain-containing protein [Pseudomonadota bacterium]
MSILLGLVVLIALATAGFAVYARVAPIDAARQHKDPLTATRAETPNTLLLAADRPEADGPAPVWDASPEALMEAFDAVALGAERTTRLAGSVADLHATYLQRSLLMGYPDFVSVRALPAEGGGATLALYSRSKYGRSDLGVNAARISAWLDRIELPRLR